MSRQEDDQLIRNDILQFLMTIPGERVMRPDFGVHLRDAVFEPNDVSTALLLESDIRTGLLDNDKRLSEVEVTLEIDEENNGMTIHVVAQLRNDPEQFVTVDQFLGFASGP